MNAPSSPLPDIQNLSPDIPITINNVGIKALRIQLRVPDSRGGAQAAIAACSLGVSLSRTQRGAHMSRLIEAVNAWDSVLEPASLRKLLEDLRLRLDSASAQASFRFPYFMDKTSPSGAKARMDYQCGLKAELSGQALSLSLFLEIPVMTVCPCSTAICDRGGHSQRALVRLRLEVADFASFDNYINLAEDSASSAVYTLLKREDEKSIIESAFARPAFVEDVARKAAFLLEKEKMVQSFEVEVESMESIHNHNAFALIQG